MAQISFTPAAGLRQIGTQSDLIEGDNALVKALDAFREIEPLPFARESSELFDRPSLKLGRALPPFTRNRRGAPTRNE